MNKPTVKTMTVTVGRKIQLAPYEGLEISLTETYDPAPKLAEDRDDLVVRLSRRILKIEKQERVRYKQNLGK